MHVVAGVQDSLLQVGPHAAAALLLQVSGPAPCYVSNAYPITHFVCHPLLQVGAQLTFARGSATLTLFLGNKHATLPVQRLAAAVAPSPAAKVAVGSLPSDIAPKQQVQVVLQVAVLQPFVEPPVMSVSSLAEAVAVPVAA